MIRGSSALVALPKLLVTWAPDWSHLRARSYPAELGVIEHVVGFNAELRIHLLLDLEVLEQRNVGVIWSPGRERRSPACYLTRVPASHRPYP
jgi:hypothetical protein